MCANLSENPPAHPAPEALEQEWRDRSRIADDLTVAYKAGVAHPAEALEKALAETLKVAEAMASTGAMVTHVVEMFRALAPSPDGGKGTK